MLRRGWQTQKTARNTFLAELHSVVQSAAFFEGTELVVVFATTSFSMTTSLRRHRCSTEHHRRNARRRSPEDHVGRSVPNPPFSPHRAKCVSRALHPATPGISHLSASPAPHPRPNPYRSLNIHDGLRYVSVCNQQHRGRPCSTSANWLKSNKLTRRSGIHKYPWL